MQKTTFDFDLFIADDCSTDGTRQILLEYKAKFPTKIHLILQETNVGPARNWIRLIESPTSKYIAYQEGDDYWVDDRKLQKQCQFLEENEDYILTFHNTLDWDGKASRKMYDQLQHDFTLAEFVHHTYARSVSVVYRNPRVKLPRAFQTIRLGDSAWFIFLLQFGKARFFDEVMAHYRIHSAGAWNSKKNSEKVLLRFELFLGVLEFLDEKYHQLVEKELFELSLTYCLNALRHRNIKKALVGLSYFARSPVRFKASKFLRIVKNRSRYQ